MDDRANTGRMMRVPVRKAQGYKSSGADAGAVVLVVASVDGHVRVFKHSADVVSCRLSTLPPLMQSSSRKQL